MDLRADASLDVPMASVFAALADLGTYPSWLTIVGAAVPAEALTGDPGPAWAVDLVGRIGFVVRRKRVRMVRADCDDGAGTVRFERVEHDGRTHNDWILRAAASPDGRLPDRTAVALHLHYGGSARVPGSDLLLGQEVRRAGARLEAYLRSRRSCG